MSPRPDQVGAVLLHALPASDPMFRLTFAESCLDSFNDFAGACNVKIAFSQYIDETWTIGRLVFRHELVSADGFEICELQDPDASCAEANRSVDVPFSTQISGQSGMGGPHLVFGTVDVVRVRPVPSQEVPLSGAVRRLLLPSLLVAAASRLRSLRKAAPSGQG